MRRVSQASSANPVIVLVSGADTDRLEAVMSRYAEEYDLLTATSSGAAAEVAAGVVGEGREVALLVTDGALPDEEIRAACERWRSTVPTARRVVLAPIERFVDEAKEMRAELAKGTFDSYLILPQGIRDEEFHNASPTCSPTGTPPWPTAPAPTPPGCHPRSPSTTTASCSPAATSHRTRGPTASRPPTLRPPSPGCSRSATSGRAR